MSEICTRAQKWTRHDLYRSLTKPKSQTCLLHVEELWGHITRFTRKILVGIIPVLQSLLWGFRGLDEVTGGSERTSFPPHTKASPWGRGVWIPYVLVFEGQKSTSQTACCKQLVSWTSKVENTKNQWLLHDIHCDGEKIWPNIDLNKSCTYVDYCIKDNIYTFFLQNEWKLIPSITSFTN